MSHALGIMITKDRLYYYEYNGTADILLPELYNTPEEVYDNWRKKDLHFGHQCRCKKVIGYAYTTYSDSMVLETSICEKHLRITGPRMVYDDYE